LLSCITGYSAFWWQVWLALAVIIMILPHHLINLGVIFLYKWRMYGDFGVVLDRNCFSFSLFPSFPSLSSSANPSICYLLLI
jgi:hypothetical protein